MRIRSVAPKVPLGSRLQAPVQQATATDTAGGFKRGRDDAEDSESKSQYDSSERNLIDDEEDPHVDSTKVEKSGDCEAY